MGFLDIWLYLSPQGMRGHEEGVTAWLPAHWADVAMRTSPSLQPQLSRASPFPPPLSPRHLRKFCVHSIPHSLQV